MIEYGYVNSVDVSNTFLVTWRQAKPILCWRLTLEKPKFEPVTITLTPVEKEMLEDLMAWRHPTDGRVISMTIRECIREAHEREKAAREQKGRE